MIDAVGVRDQGVRQRAQVQQLIPVGVVASQPADLDAEDDPDMPEADVGDEFLEALPCSGLRTRPSQVRVDHPDLMRIPAERDRAFP